MKPTAPPEPVEAPPLAIPLRAGPLRLVFDRGELRWLRLGECEVLRGIYAAVRESGWATVPARIEGLEVVATTDSFRITFVARHERGDVRFDWAARIEGGADGRIVYSIDGSAGSTFLRNRIGFCVLHPAAGCAGTRCTVETVGGELRAAVFPRLVSPHQPLLDLRAITHEPAPGVTAEVRMEGDTFETEDQRNWSDASFKTYCTPLALPYPVEVQAGTRLRQTITLALHGAPEASFEDAVAAVPGAQAKKRDGTEPVPVRVDPSRTHALPALGMAGAGLVRLRPADAAAWRALGLSHLRADLHLGDDGWLHALELAAANARLLSVPLELALFLPDPIEPALAAVAEKVPGLGAKVGCWLLFRVGDVVTHAGDASLARRILAPVSPAARFAGGTDRYFTELNRARPSPAGLDRLTFSLNPQVHAFDDHTLFENLASLPWLVATAATFAEGRPLGISPVTLRPRHDARPASSRGPGERPFTDDPRQEQAIAAAWTLAFVGSAAQAGVASLTFFELSGPRGVMDSGRVFPVYHAFAALAALPGAAVLAASSHRPERIQVLALRAPGGTRVFLANVTPDPHPVRLEGLAGRARCSPLGATEPGEVCELEHDLPARSILRLDFEDEE